MEHTEQDASPGGSALEHTIQEFLGRGQKAGNYRAGLKRVLSGAGDETTAATQPFRTFVEDRGTKQATEINKRDLAAYAEHLADAVADAEDRSTTTDGISAATAWTYYDFVSAYLSYLVEWEYLEENPARKGPATDQFPHDRLSRPTKRTSGIPKTAADCSGSLTSAQSRHSTRRILTPSKRFETEHSPTSSHIRA